MENKPLAVAELYTCMQGEGKYAGIPHILIRTTGCTLRCQFADSFCDTWYTSWKPEKGQITIEAIRALYKANPQIHYTMITGGEPTMQATLLNQLVDIAKEFHHLVTIETAGTDFVQTKADLISLSPKLKNSEPRPLTPTPWDKGLVSEKQYLQHSSKRKSYSAMKELITSHPDYLLKPVISNEDDLMEVKYIQEILDIPNYRVYLMPEGINEEQLNKRRKWLFDVCIKEGYRYTDRLHVIVYGEKRGV